MNCRCALVVVVFGLTLPVSVLLGQTTPLDFAQRRDVGREILLQPMQRAAIQALGPVCDAQCQAYVALNFNEISDDARLAYGALPSEVQNQIVANQEAEVQEEVELNAIDDVLADPQMDRFRQLWTQFQGVDSLTSGFVSDALNLSDDQLSELQDLQLGASQLRNDCVGNSALTADQRASIIQNINNGVIDQSINILENAQLAIYINLCGEPCDFDPSEDSQDEPTEQPSAGPDLQQPDAGPDPGETEGVPADAIPAQQGNENGSGTRIARNNRLANTTATPPNQDRQANQNDGQNSRPQNASPSRTENRPSRNSVAATGQQNQESDASNPPKEKRPNRR